MSESKVVEELANKATHNYMVYRQTLMMEMLAAVWLDTHSTKEVAQIFRDYAEYLESVDY